MIIDILTLFPSMFSGPFEESIIKRAVKLGLVKINYVDIRDFGIGKHKTVDDRPYGGGVGMVMRVDVIVNAISNIKNQISKTKSKNIKTILLDPRGRTYDQQMAREFSKLDQLVLICGHYEGIDERVKSFVDCPISIGDYVLTGGEIPAMAVVDSVVRLIPGVLIKPEATKLESFSESVCHSEAAKGGRRIPLDSRRQRESFIPIKSGFRMTTLEYPQYTRPEVFRGLKVPEVLLSGDHQKIKEWRKKKTGIK